MRQSVSVLLGESVFDVLSSFCCCSVLFSFRLIVLLAFYPIATNPFYFFLSLIPFSLLLAYPKHSSNQPILPFISHSNKHRINRMNIQIQHIECPILNLAFAFACDSEDSPSPVAPARAESEAATPSPSADAAANKPIPRSSTGFHNNHIPYSRNHSIKVFVIKRTVHMGNKRHIHLLMKHCIPVETRKERMILDSISCIIHSFQNSHAQFI